MAYLPASNVASQHVCSPLRCPFPGDIFVQYCSSTLTYGTTSRRQRTPAPSSPNSTSATAGAASSATKHSPEPRLLPPGIVNRHLVQCLVLLFFPATGSQPGATLKLPLFSYCQVVKSDPPKLFLAVTFRGTRPQATQRHTHRRLKHWTKIAKLALVWALSQPGISHGLEIP